VELSPKRQYALSMALATSHPHNWVQIGTVHGTVHRFFPIWAVGLIYAAYLGIVITGVVVMGRATTRMTRPGRILVWLIALWATVSGIAAFLDVYRPTGDWLGRRT
jgi:hypothetical protein